MIAILDAEARAGFPRLRGACIAGTVPLTQGLLNELFDGSRIVPVLEIRDGNRIVSTLWGMSVAATIISVTPALVVTVDLPWFARKLAAMAPYVRIDGPYVQVDLGALPPVARHRYLWRHLTMVAVETSEGRMRVRFEMVIA